MSMGKIVNDSEIKIHLSTDLPLSERTMITKTNTVTMIGNVREAICAYLHLGT